MEDGEAFFLHYVVKVGEYLKLKFGVRSRQQLLPDKFKYSHQLFAV